MFQNARKKLIKVELTKYFNKPDEVLQALSLAHFKNLAKKPTVSSKIKNSSVGLKRKQLKL